MKAVKALKNQYLGINADLNSYWQNDEAWSEFHTSYIVHISRAEQIDFDFGTPYERMLEMELFTLETIDYRLLPIKFNRYTPADQQRIANQMLAVLEAAKQGIDLETVPFQPSLFLWKKRSSGSKPSNKRRNHLC